MKNEAEELFYVRIRDPTEFRRCVLECLKDTIQLLKRYEEFKRIREKKIEYIMLLKNIVAETSKLSYQLKSELPRAKFSRVITRQASNISPKGRSSDSIDMLENELEDIESKLKSLV